MSYVFVKIYSMFLRNTDDKEEEESAALYVVDMSKALLF